MFNTTRLREITQLLVAPDAKQARPEPPPPDQEPPLPWEPIVPLADEQEPTPFPEDALPELLMQFAVEAAASVHCPVDFAAVPMLALGGAAIGASRGLEIKQGRIERPCLYVAAVGNPSCGKTPCMDKVAEPIYQEQARLTEHYQRALQAHEDGVDDCPKPTERALFVADITTEKLASILSENPRGVVVIRDELTGWVRSMDQYRSGRGADRQFWLSAWSSVPIAVHRKQSGTIRVPHPYVSVVGGLPPDLLAAMRGERNISDGFFERILWAYPREMRACGETWAVVPQDLEESWRNCLAWLRQLEQQSSLDHGPSPQLLGLTSCGQHAWKKLTDALAAARNDSSTPDCLQGALGKLNSYGARLALIVHLLRQAMGENAGAAVDGESMGRAHRLVNYFFGQARRVYATLDADERVAAARKVLAWIPAGTTDGRFSRRDCHQALRGEFPTVDDLDPVLRLLQQHGYIRVERAADRAGPGRKPSPMYEAHPSLM